MTNLGPDIDPTWEPASDLEARFAQLWVTLFPTVDLYTEYQFSKRKFRFDFCCPTSKVAIEIQGGTWSAGGHSTGKGIASDYEKINLAQYLGWQVFLLTTDTYQDEAVLTQIANTIQQRKKERAA